MSRPGILRRRCGTGRRRGSNQANQAQDLTLFCASGGIQLNGWKHLNELRTPSKGSRQAFVAMRFNEELRIVCDNATRPAIKATGFNAFRVDNAANNNPVGDEIIAGIKRSRFIVADFTEQRHAVFF